MKTNNSTKKGGYLKKEYYNDFAKSLAEFVKSIKDVKHTNGSIDILEAVNEKEDDISFDNSY